MRTPRDENASPPFEMIGLLGMEAVGIKPTARRKQDPKQAALFRLTP
jgi:hypothetical protein